MKVIIAGGGIGGLVTALMLHARGIDCEIFEQADQVRELGVGINTLPHAIKELAALGLLDRGRLQGVIYQAVRARLGETRIHFGHRLGAFNQDEGGVTAYFFDRSGAHRASARGDILVGADGIHSAVREALYPNEGPARWNGAMLWRGAIEWPRFLTGRSMIVAGGMAAKLVVYPIAEGSRDDRKLTNWAVVGRIGDGTTPPPRKEDWSRLGRMTDLAPHIARFEIGHVEAKRLIEATPEFWEYPMCDRDPLPRWSHGRVTLLGDAAHPMYPVGSNGASQAILDARALADLLVRAEHPVQALWAYEQERLPPTAQIVRMNRSGGPEGVIDAVEARAPDGFSDIDAIMSYEQRQAIVRGYAATAGFAREQVNRAAAAAPAR